MNTKSISILILGLLVSFSVTAQSSDHSVGSFSLVGGEDWHGGIDDASASMEVFSDGKYIHVFLDVRDDIVISDKNTLAGDHVRLNFALPKASYPNLFSHQYHPYYFHTRTQASRGNSPDPAHRFFSTILNDASTLDITLLDGAIPYPSEQRIKEETLDIPPANKLNTTRVDFGMVSYALFPDGRPAELLNKGHYKKLEENLQAELGDVAAGIVYSVDRREDGFVFNIQLAPQALGFVNLPELSSIRFSADYFDFDVKKGLSTIISSVQTGPSGDHRGRAMDLITFNKNINTNFSAVPDRIFNVTGYSPILFFTQKGWISTLVDCDPLSLGNYNTSQNLTEVVFNPSVFDYNIWQEHGTQLSVEQIQVKHQLVNELPTLIEYTLVDNQLFTHSRYQNRVQVLDTSFHSRAFNFPDGGVGFIGVENSPLHPQGWGPCGLCVQEQISIFRLTPNGPKKIIQVRQGESENNYLEVGDITLDGFYIDRLDWVKPGEILVFQLYNPLTSERKRIRSSWAKDGSSAKTELLP